MSYTTEQLQKLRQVAARGDVTFILYPTAYVRDQLVKNVHPMVQGMNPQWKVALISGWSVDLEPFLVLEFLDGSMEKNAPKNYWLMSHCEIRVLENRDIKYVREQGE